MRALARVRARVTRYVHVVIGGGIILGAYTAIDSAWLHARTVSGADVVTVELLDSVPDEVRGDIATEYDGDEITPVTAPPVPDEDPKRR